MIPYRVSVPFSLGSQWTSTSQCKAPGCKLEKKMPFIYTETDLTAGNQKDPHLPLT